jgi:hypothetical protein
VTIDERSLAPHDATPSETIFETIFDTIWTRSGHDQKGTL